MKSSADVLNYIDQYYAYLIARPEMYAHSPNDLENIIFVLENLRAFILDDPRAGQAFNTFTTELGFGSMGISYNPEIDGRHAKTDDLPRFQAIADVLKEFLERQGRLCDCNEDFGDCIE